MTNDRDQFRKVDTGNGIDRDLAATTNDRLELTVIELQKLQENNTQQTKKLGSLLGSLEDVIGDNLIFLQQDIRNLRNSIENANSTNNKLQKKFLLLSIIATIFTVASIVQVIDILVRGIGK